MYRQSISHREASCSLPYLNKMPSSTLPIDENIIDIDMDFGSPMPMPATTGTVTSDKSSKWTTPSLQDSTMPRRLDMEGTPSLNAEEPGNSKPPSVDGKNTRLRLLPNRDNADAYKFIIEEASQWVREMQAVQDDLDLLQVQNAVLLDTLTMAGADI